MMEGECFAVSSLTSSFQSDLPFLTDHSDSRGLLTSNSDLSLIVDRYLRALVWGVFIILTAVVLLFVIAIHFCCVHYCYFKHTDSDQPETIKFKVLKRGCCTFTTLSLILCLCITGAALWAEVALNNTLREHLSQEDDRIETTRHWVTIALFVLVGLFLLLTFVTMMVASCASKTYRVFNVMVGLLSGITLLLALVAGPVFSFMIVASDLCTDLSQIQSNSGGSMSQCTTEFINSGMVYCNEAFMYAFIMLILGCGLILCLPLSQCCGVIYAGTLSCSAQRSRVRPQDSDSIAEENRRPSAPTMQTIENFYTQSDHNDGSGDLRESQNLMTMPLIPAQSKDTSTTNGILLPVPSHTGSDPNQPPAYSQAVPAVADPHLGASLNISVVSTRSGAHGLQSLNRRPDAQHKISVTSDETSL